jgi:prepilin-type N-terminal cleavage/methylation domain-containing protein
MSARKSLGRHGVTLVEMLVVIGIIVILAAILIPSVQVAMNAARRTQNAQEIAQLNMALEKYASENKGLYPPSFGEGSYATAFGNGTHRNSRLYRYLNKAYPKIHPIQEQWLFQNAADNLDQSSALVFWLSQTGPDPRYPFVNGPQGDPAAARKYFEFDVRRLTGMYYRPPAARESYYIYIEAKHYPLHVGSNLLAPNQPVAGYAPLSAETSVRPFVKRNRVDNDGTNLRNYVNSDTYQLHCAGLDGRFSVDNSVLRTFPSGDSGQAPGAPLTLIPNDLYQDDLDNQTNFSEGRPLSEHTVD